MSKIRTVCVVCGKFKTPIGSWEIREADGDNLTLLSHGLCPACAEEFYSKYLDDSATALARQKDLASSLGVVHTR